MQHRMNGHQEQEQIKPYAVVSVVFRNGAKPSRTWIIKKVKIPHTL